MKFKFDLKNRLDLAILIMTIIWVVTGAFLRFFQYFFKPIETEKLTLILIPETLILLGLIAYKIWRLL